MDMQSGVFDCYEFDLQIFGFVLSTVTRLQFVPAVLFLSRLSYICIWDTPYNISCDLRKDGFLDNLSIFP
uniref:Uncharacterized protein n=1 Tax=Megaselia scalaris TaxID=36166 RepID=T1H4Y9_MEGSC